MSIGVKYKLPHNIFPSKYYKATIVVQFQNQQLGTLLAFLEIRNQKLQIQKTITCKWNSKRQIIQKYNENYQNMSTLTITYSSYTIIYHLHFFYFREVGGKLSIYIFFRKKMNFLTEQSASVIFYLSASLAFIYSCP